jgi:hypothetical protein
MDFRKQLPKEKTKELKAFLLKHDIHKSNRPNTGFLDSSTTQLQFPSRNPQHDEHTHYDIYFPTTTQPPPPQWSGTVLAKKQSFQEQMTFAKRQCVRFVVPSDEGYSASCNDYGDDDKDDGEETTKANNAWKYSPLAKMYEAYERNSFKTGSLKGSRPLRHRSCFSWLI